MYDIKKYWVYIYSIYFLYIIFNFNKLDTESQEVIYRNVLSMLFSIVFSLGFFFHPVRKKDSTNDYIICSTV